MLLIKLERNRSGPDVIARAAGGASGFRGMSG
jgi:hypothetical protein